MPAAYHGAVVEVLGQPGDAFKSERAALGHQCSDSSHTTLVDPVTLPTLAEIVA